LKDFRGVNPEHTAILAAAGIRNVEQMLKAGRTPRARQELADATGIPLAAILELVKLSDLARIPGIKTVRARLYHDAGVDTVEKMAEWDSEELRAMLFEFVERTGFDGIAPLPGEAAFSVARAKELPKIIEY
jgi:predicted flap endonuclease-1-like 5' DNA nuclease